MCGLAVDSAGARLTANSDCCDLCVSSKRMEDREKQLTEQLIKYQSKVTAER